MLNNVLVLGGIYAHQELILQLKSRGFNVILIDYNENPPSKEFVNEHIRESIYDIDLLKSIIRERNIYAVFSSNLDRTLPIISDLSDKFNLPFYLDTHKSLLVTDKMKMKTIFNENDIPTAKWIKTNELDSIKTIDLEYPLIIKPVNGTGSIGLQKVEKKENLEECFRISKKDSDGDLLIEEFCEGKEYSIDAFAFKDRVQIFTIRERLKVEIKDTNSMVCVGGVISNNFISDSILKKMDELVNNIGNAFDLNNSPLMVQLICGGDHNLIVVEIAARNSGGIAHIINKHLIGFDIISATIDASLQKSPTPWEKKITINTVCMHAIIYADGGQISKFVGFDDAVDEDIIQSYYKMRSEGDILPDTMSVKNRVAEVILFSDNINSMKDKVKSLYQKIDILNVNEESMLNQDISIINCI